MPVAHAMTPRTPPPITTNGAGMDRTSVQPNAMIPMQIDAEGNGLVAYASKVSWKTEVIIRPTAAELRPGKARR